MTPYRDDPERITYFAETDARGKRVKFGIKAKDRSKHMYVIGKTGMGKSTLLENMAIQDIQNGEGLAFIDPHGSTAEKLLDYVPQERMKDVLYFAPFDMEYPIAFNVMEDVGYDKRHLVVSGLMSAFKKIWVDAWSGRMEYILSNTLLALLEYEGSTLLDVNRMYTNKAFRRKVVENIKDPIVKAFWVDEFATYTDRYTQEATPAIQNKVGQFTSNPLIRNILGQPRSSFDLRKMMDERKIFIANLSKGRVGETNADLLGSMLTTKVYLAAMSRADLPAGALTRLPNFYFYVDEFQSIANDSFADILSEARKYKLNLTIAHQYVEQMEENVRNAVFGNVGTTVAFRVGPFDAEVLETIFKPHFTMEDLVNLGFAQVYLTLMIDGVGSQPFSAITMAPIDPPRLSYRDHILKSSREQFAHLRADIEQNISARSQELSTEDKAPPASPRGDTRDTPTRPRRSSAQEGQRGQGRRPERPPSGGRGRGERFSDNNRNQHVRKVSSDNRPPAPHVSPQNTASSLRELVAKSQQKETSPGGRNGGPTHGRDPERKTAYPDAHLADLRSTLKKLVHEQEERKDNSKKESPRPPTAPAQAKRQNNAFPKQLNKETPKQKDTRKEIPEDVLKKILDVNRE